MGMCQCLAVLQNFKRNRGGVGFVSVGSLGLYYCVLAIGNAAECYFAIFSSCEFHHCFSIGIVESKLCTGKRCFLVFINLQNFDIATNEFVLKVDGCGFAGLDLDFLLFRLYISVRSVNLFYSVSAF